MAIALGNSKNNVHFHIVWNATVLVKSNANNNRWISRFALVIYQWNFNDISHNFISNILQR